MKVFLNVLKTCLLCVSFYALLEELIFYHNVNLLLLLMASTLFVIILSFASKQWNGVRSEATFYQVLEDS